MLDGSLYSTAIWFYQGGGFDIIARKGEKTGKVGLISRSGGGHEPSTLALLERACCRPLFAEQSLLHQHLIRSYRLSKEADEALGSSWLLKLLR